MCVHKHKQTNTHTHTHCDTSEKEIFDHASHRKNGTLLKNIYFDRTHFFSVVKFLCRPLTVVVVVVVVGDFFRWCVFVCAVQGFEKQQYTESYHHAMSAILVWTFHDTERNLLDCISLGVLRNTVEQVRAVAYLPEHFLWVGKATDCS